MRSARAKPRRRPCEPFLEPTEQSASSRERDGVRRKDRVVSKIETSLDFLNAKVRAIHSRLYEGDRLNELLRYRSVSELSGVLLDGAAVASPATLERRLVERYAENLSLLWRYLPAPRDRVFIALGLRLQIENLKVILRAHAAGESGPLESLPVIPLPEPYRWPQLERRGPLTREQLLLAIPEPLVRMSAAEALVLYGEKPIPIYLEASLDRGYYSMLLQVYEALPAGDREDIGPLVALELDLQNLVFVLRSRVNYRLEAEMVTMLAARSMESRRPAAWVRTAAQKESARDIIAEAPVALRRLLAEVPAQLPEIERRLWQHYYGLAKTAYQQTFFTLGCPYAFAALKRMELANLITVVEAMRYELSFEELLSRLLRPMR